MAIYLLDKNVVEDIKQSNLGLPAPGTVMARAIDRKGNTVSPLLSILEGSVRRAQSGQEMHDQLIADTQAVGLFYRQAKTDSEYLRIVGASMAAALAPHMREKSGALVPLAQQLQALVVQQRKWNSASEVVPKIDALAREHEVSSSHPLVICAIACLYGSGSARGVLKPAVKPTQEGAYNAVADIRLTMETAYIRKMWKDGKKREGVHLLSGDRNLNVFAKQLQITVASSFLTTEAGPEIVTFSATVSPGATAQPASNAETNAARACRTQGIARR